MINRTVTDEYRLGIYIRIVRLLLEDDDATSAESYLNRASLIITPTTDEVSWLFSYVYLSNSMVTTD